MELLRELLNFNEGRLDVPTKTPEELAKKYGVPVSKINTELKKGIKVEHEHTSDWATAREIALDHLGEKLDYYEKLAKVEESKGFRASHKLPPSPTTAKAKKAKVKKYADDVSDETKKAEKRKEGRARHWAKTGVSPETIKWMRDEGML